MIARKHARRPPRQWSWLYRPGRPVVIEQDEFGLWHVFRGKNEVGIVSSKEAALRLIDLLDD